MLLAAVAVDQARDLTGMNHHSDPADKIVNEYAVGVPREGDPSRSFTVRPT